MKSKIGYFEVNKKVELKFTKEAPELKGDSILILKHGDKGLGMVAPYSTLNEWVRALELVRENKIKSTNDLCLLSEKKEEIIELDMERELESPKQDDKKQEEKKVETVCFFVTILHFTIC